MPQTICHFDVFKRNAFAQKTEDGEDQTVLIDWAYVGRGPIGADLSPLIWMSVTFSDVELGEMPYLEEIVFEGYLEGLQEAGWQGDPKQVRLGYLAAGIRYMFGEIGRWVTICLDERLHPGFEQSIGRSIGEILDFAAVTRRIFIKKLDEARALIRMEN